MQMEKSPKLSERRNEYEPFEAYAARLGYTSVADLIADCFEGITPEMAAAASRGAAERVNAVLAELGENAYDPDDPSQNQSTGVTIHY